MIKRGIKSLLAIFFVAGALLASYPFYLATHQKQITRTNQLAALLPATVSEPLELDPPTKSFDCKINGPLPDHECSPGAIFPDATREIICVSGYTKTVRNVSVSLKKRVYAAYGIAYPPPFGSYEADHIIPLALGGNNDFANLFPESAEPYPGFKEKDVVENYLHDEVCAGRVDLKVAQVQIANDWVSVYNNLDPKIITAYKTKYKSWADRDID